MNLTEMAVLILNEAGYETRSTVSARDMFYFEGDAILGFVCAYQTPTDLLHGWSAKQDAFLRTSRAGAPRKS